MSNGTPALAHLLRENIPHHVHHYERPATDRRAASRGDRLTYGAAAATALGISASAMFKSLVLSLEQGGEASSARGSALCFALLPVDREVSLKRVAHVFGARRAELLDAASVTRVTGYVIGGVSPLGSKRALPVVIDQSVRSLSRLYLSAGQRGVAVELASEDLIRALDAQVAPISMAEEA